MNEINTRVDSSTNVIQHLSKRSEEIANIIDVINEIAGQTNLLALNAAIEAARAGTHGRGFAVVADEIRKLADQTTQSTTGIEDMVKGIQAETDQAVGAMKESSVLVDEGVQMADDANNVLSNVMDMSNHVSESIDELAELSIQQSETVSKINSNINMISQVTNESSESAQGLLKIAQDLNKHMGSLKDIDRRFKL
jgi:methyl-accepting chemotaxis protein